MGLLLLRYGELALKGHNRTIFVRLLRHNVRAALKAAGVPGRVRTEGARVLVETDAPEALEGPLSRVFGLTSLSTVTRVPREIEAIAEECVRQARIAGVGPAVSYRVQARRADKTFPLTSPEINRAAGEAIGAVPWVRTSRTMRRPLAWRFAQRAKSATPPRCCERRDGSLSAPTWVAPPPA